MFSSTLIRRGISALFAACLACGAVLAADDLFPDPAVARAKGFEIKRSQVQDALIIYKSSMAARGRPVSDLERPAIESNLLERIIITEILSRKATDAEKVKAKADTDQLIADAKKEYKDTFDIQVKAQGMSVEQFTQRALEQNTCELVLEREVKSAVVVKDDAVQKFYTDHPQDFVQSPRVRVAQLSLSGLDPATDQPLPAERKREKLKLIRELKDRVDKGEDFALLIKDFSEDRNTRDKGGEYKFARNQMPAEIEAAAFSLKTNQVSDVVETPLGYHLIKLLERTPEKKVELAEAASKIKEYLIRTEYQNRVPDYLKKIQAEAGVVILDAAKGK